MTPMKLETDIAGNKSLWFFSKKLENINFIQKKPTLMSGLFNCEYIKT